MQKLKNRIQLGSTVDKELFKKIKKMSDETMIPMSKLIDKAIKLLLNEKFERND